MNAHEPFIRPILEVPDDDAPRLVYADWLEENGDRERAEFIRVQCELAAMELAYVDPECTWGATCVCRSHRRLRELRGREQELRGSFYEVGAFATFRRGFVERVEMPAADFLRHAEALFRSHPVIEVVLTDKEPGWSRPGDFNWHRMASRPADGRDELPPPVWDRLSDRPDDWCARYDSREAALADLSRACVAHGRDLAGLPPLPLATPKPAR